ncbi:hypothetical protein [Nostoc sp. FACHB-110]|nr:hypothetical protein [Nostoc sp. FACHB-110]
MMVGELPTLLRLRSVGFWFHRQQPFHLAAYWSYVASTQQERGSLRP